MFRDRCIYFQQICEERSRFPRSVILIASWTRVHHVSFSDISIVCKIRIQFLLRGSCSFGLRLILDCLISTGRGLGHWHCFSVSVFQPVILLELLVFSVSIREHGIFCIHQSVVSCLDVPGIVSTSPFWSSWVSSIYSYLLCSTLRTGEGISQELYPITRGHRKTMSSG